MYVGNRFSSLVGFLNLSFYSFYIYIFFFFDKTKRPISYLIHSLFFLLLLFFCIFSLLFIELSRYTIDVSIKIRISAVRQTICFLGHIEEESKATGNDFLYQDDTKRYYVVIQVATKKEQWLMVLTSGHLLALIFIPLNVYGPTLKGGYVYNRGDQIISMDWVKAVIKTNVQRSICTRKDQGCHRSQWTHHPLLDARTFFFFYY